MIVVNGIVKAPQDIGKEVALVISKTMMTIAAVAQRAAKIAAPANTGQLRNSILTFSGQEAEGKFQSGIVTNLPYALVMEDGRRPGGKFPPADAMFRFVWLKRREFGIKGGRGEVGRVESVAFLVGRKIAKFGIVGRKFFEKAAKEVEARFSELTRSFELDIQRAWTKGG